MAELPYDLLTQSIDIFFAPTRPILGDLFLICGDKHPRFPPSGKFAFNSLADLQFEQVGDYFGVRSLNDEGDNVPIWLYPLIDGEPVYHNPGPFDGVRLNYRWAWAGDQHRSANHLPCSVEATD